MKKSAGLIIAILCVSAGATLGASPKDEYLSFWQKVKEQKYDEAAKHLFPIEDAEFLEKQKELFNTNSSMLQQGTLKVDVVDSKIQNKWAFLVVHISVTQGGKTSDSLQYEIMALDGETWKHVFKQKASDPSLSKHSQDDFIALEKWWQANREKYRKKK